MLEFLVGLHMGSVVGFFLAWLGYEIAMQLDRKERPCRKN